MKFGSLVTVVEIQDEILPGIDPLLIRVVKKHLQQDGVKFFTASQAKKWTKKSNETIEVEIESKSEGKMKLKTTKILLSVGKRASTQSLDLEKAGVKTNQQGFIEVNTKQQTNNSSI